MVMQLGMRQQMFCAWLSLFLVLFTRSQVEPLPVKLSNEENDFISYLNSMTQKDSSKMKEKRLVPTPRHTNNLTVGDLIYLTYVDEVPFEMHNLLVEMDIVNSTFIKHVMENGVTGAVQEKPGHKQRRTATINEDLWPDGRIPYTFSASVTPQGREAAMEGMFYWMERTCLQFVPKESGDVDYIEFVEYDGCWSYVGRVGKVQYISLGRGRRSHCKTLGVVLHELGHVLGLWHEQSRPDRDKYIEIRWGNVETGAEKNFLKYSRSSVETFSLPYDYGSIMHYSAYAFSKNENRTIIPLKPGVSVMGQRKDLSPLDIKAANLLYNCQITNSTREKAVNVSDVIPKDAFLIVNSHTRTCLDISNRTTDWTAPILDQHIYAGLYYVTLTECIPDNKDQYWKWTSDGALLHLGTFLCLTVLNSEFINNKYVTDLLVLMHCRGGDIRQKWVCSEGFVKNPNPQSEKCLLASTDTNSRKKRSVESDSEALLNELVEEMGSMSIKTRPPNGRDHNFNVNLDTGASLSNHSIMATLNDCEQTNVNQTWCSVYSKATDQNSSEQISQPGSLCMRTNDTVSHQQPACYAKDMSTTAGLAFYYARWVGCDELGYYASGFYHADQISGNGATAVLTGIDCCMSGSVFTGRPDGPPPIHREECVNIEWWNWQDTLISEGWFSCPRGMFLKSFLLTARPYTLGHYIWKVKCCKPESSPVVYEHCYKDYGKTVAMDTGVHRCSLEGHHVTGMYKRGCNASSRECVEEIMCCMALGV